MATGPAQPPRNELLLRCAWCGRVRNGGEWVAPEGPLDGESLTHGICPECVASVPTPATGRLD